MIELVSNLFLKETGIKKKLELQCLDKNGIMGSVMLLKEKEVEVPSYLYALTVSIRQTASNCCLSTNLLQVAAILYKKSRLVVQVDQVGTIRLQVDATRSRVGLLAIYKEEVLRCLYGRHHIPGSCSGHLPSIPGG